MRAILRSMLLLLALPLGAQTIHESMLVSTEWLHGHLGSVTVLHIGDRAGYDVRHIPGAVLVETSSIVTQRDGIPNELPGIGQLEDVFRAAGVGVRDRIVVTADDSILAARAWFTLDYLGQGDRTALLDGGNAKWVADGYAASTEPVHPRAGTFEASVLAEAVVHLATMRELVRLRDQIGPSLVLLDARAQEQFCGGAIPGAVNLPVTANLDVTGAFRSVHDLRVMYHQAGVLPDSTNIAYCRTGMQAAVTYFVLRYLGYDAALYDGSYVEWTV